MEYHAFKQGLGKALQFAVLGLVGCAVSVHSIAHDEAAFKAFLNTLKQEAIAQAVPPEVVEATMAQVQWLPKVVELDRKQPEFVTAFATYVGRRIQPRTVLMGKQLLEDYAGVFSVVEEYYPVPREVLVAFWGLETNFGKVQGDFSLPSALASLAYEGRRAAFFKQELINWMRVMPNTPHTAASIHSSWAGATGQMQFMPSTLRQYGVDADHDGLVDIWQSLPDVFHSAANYLTQIGWQAGAPMSQAVTLPTGFDYELAQLRLKKSLGAWRALGVQGIPTHYEDQQTAALVLPQGFDGPAYLVFANFEVIMQWNRSLNYALSVSLMAQQLRQAQFDLSLPPEPPALSFQQMWALQEALNAQGYDCGPPDGFPGTLTQAAIRRYQAAHGLPQDGYAGYALYQRLMGF